jgi:hypothetical protein
MKGAGGGAEGAHLARDGKRVSGVRLLKHGADALDGAHERRELVLVEILQARDGPRGAYEDVFDARVRRGRSVRAREGTHGRGRAA